MVATPESSRPGRGAASGSVLPLPGLAPKPLPSRPDPDLLEIAERFHLPGPITTIEPLGNGNVNATYLVVTATAGCHAFVLQRLNAHVFPQPELVMGNLMVLVEHVGRRLQDPPPGLRERRWELPAVVESRSGAHWCRRGDQFWRMTRFIEASRSYDTLADGDQAREVGFALGSFHALIADLPAELLSDTLAGFHITPAYLAALDAVVAAPVRPACPEVEAALAFVELRRGLAGVLEQAKADGRLPLRPIHGDPKVNNVLFDRHSDQAIALIDLDTVKPGLLHYDIGDALRSACNRLGEETLDLAAVSFDLDLCRALLEGYFAAARGVLSPAERDHLYDAIRLIPFELGLRFLADHLAGDVYFRVDHPGQNLARARVQFQLTRSIELQEQPIRALIQSLA